MAIPPAQVAQPPLRHRPGIVRYWKRLAVVAVILAGSWWTCRKIGDRPDYFLKSARETNTAEAYARYAETHGNPGAVRGSLKKLHAAARARLKVLYAANPGALDPIFTRFADKIDYRIGFVTVESKLDEASFAAVATRLAEPGITVAPFTGPLSDWACARGMNVAGLAAVRRVHDWRSERAISGHLHLPATQVSCDNGAASTARHFSCRSIITCNTYCRAGSGWSES